MRINGRRTFLRPLSTMDYNTLYSFVAEDSSTWRWQGLPIGPEGFAETLRSTALARFVICDRNGGVIGLVACYNANLVHGTAYLEVLLGSNHQKMGWPVEGGILFLEYLFQTFPLRKVYIESTEVRLPDIGSITMFGADLEGTFRSHLLHQGRYIDGIVLAITRESFRSNSTRFRTVDEWPRE